MSSKNAELKLLFFIADWNRLQDISAEFEKANVNFHFIGKGRGTASSEILDLLGIGAGDKAVVTCLEQPEMVSVLMQEVRKKINFHSPGAGIAFTVPLSGINSPLLRVFKSPDNNEADDEKRHSGNDRRRSDRRDSGKSSHVLIMSIINRGYSDEFMNIARKSGARGGTILNARSQTFQGTLKYFGISIQDERELILILTNRDMGIPLMKAICDNYGLSSKAQGIVFSLPVDNVMGLSFE